MDFYGLYHYDEIEPKTGKVKPNTNAHKSHMPDPSKSGIYIWGFVYYYNDYGLIAPANCTNADPAFDKAIMKFIPYYVGKKKYSAFSRICEHHSVRSGNAECYIRLSDCFMKEFFKHPLFPILWTSSPKVLNFINLIKTYPNAITYHNRDIILREIYPYLHIATTLKGDHPITMQIINGQPIPDTLDYLVNYLNNFWFCYAEVPDDAVNEKNEADAFYSLKGKTVSHTEMNGHRIVNINDYTNTEIFKKDDLGKVSASPDFSGY